MRWRRKVVPEGGKKAVGIEPMAFLAFFVFCSQAVPSYSNVRKKTKFRYFLNSLHPVIKLFYKAPETRQNIINRIMPPLIVRGGVNTKC